MDIMKYNSDIATRSFFFWCWPAGQPYFNIYIIVFQGKRRFGPERSLKYQPARYYNNFK